MRHQLLSFAMAFACLWSASSPAEAQVGTGAPKPARVVSMNLCTDQLAILLADENQLISVSRLAVDPTLSVLSEQAKAYQINYGGAEEIYLLKPDLVIAGTYTNQFTVDLLRSLDIEVVQVSPIRSLDEISQQLRRIGQVLGQDAKAAKLIDTFEHRLEAIRAKQPERQPEAAVYYANGYTSGNGRLVSDLLKTAGLENTASRLGLKGTTKLPLELLVMEKPELLVHGSQFSDKPALAFELLAHPALQASVGENGRTFIPDQYTICGLPFVSKALDILSAAANAKSQERP